MAWQPSDRFKAIRLLGRQPLDIWDDERVRGIYLDCWAVGQVDVPIFLDVARELHNGERKRLEQQIEERWAWIDGRQTAGPEAGRAGLLGLIAEEEARLEEVLAIHLEREEA